MTTLLTVNQHFEAARKRFSPDRTAFTIEELPVSFAELTECVDRLAAGLAAQGVGPDSVVGYSLPNCREVIAIILAISRLGACAVPLYPMTPDAVRAGIFASMGCSLVVTLGPSVQGLSQAAERMQARFRVVPLEAVLAADGYGQTPPFESSPTRRFLAAASSGTTGAPKSVWMTQGNAASTLTGTTEFAQLGSWQQNPCYTCMAVFPLSTSSVLVSLGMVLTGVRMVFLQDMSPVRYLQLAEHFAAEVLSAPPAYFEAILNLPPHLRRPLPALRAIMTGMDFLHTSLLNRLTQCFPGICCAASGYGLVETSLVLMTWKGHDREQLKQTPNRFTLCSNLGNQLDVRDEDGQSLTPGRVGELWVKGPSVVSGYLGQATMNAGSFVDGWFRTGDVACAVDAQTIELLGRQKYVIKRGGRSVSPIEVQERLDACPGVAASAVVGVKQPLYGEMIWAFVVPTRGQPITLKDVMKTCRATLPNYMVPDQVTFLTELPRGSGVGKLDREALIVMAKEELGKIQGESRV
jgi:long-chain acyl-CoA synthetase